MFVAFRVDGAVMKDPVPTRAPLSDRRWRRRRRVASFLCSAWPDILCEPSGEAADVFEQRAVRGRRSYSSGSGILNEYLEAVSARRGHAISPLHVMCEGNTSPVPACPLMKTGDALRR